MPFTQKVLAISLSVGLLILIFELVRRRKLREEYSWLWMLAGVITLILAIWYDLLLFITRLVGAAVPTSILFLFGIFFIVLVELYFSVKISTLTNQIKELVQRQAILDNYIEEHLKIDRMKK